MSEGRVECGSPRKEYCGRRRLMSVLVLVALAAALTPAAQGAHRAVGRWAVRAGRARAAATSRRGATHSRAAGCGSGSCRAQRRQPRFDHRARAPVRGRHADDQEQRRDDALVAVHAAARVGAARQRTARSAPGSTCTATTRSSRRRSGAAGRQGRRRLPADRRRESSTRASTSQAQTYIQRLRKLIGAELPARAGRLPVHRLPPGVPVLGVPRPRRRAVQRAADVLEGHRYERRRRLRPHLRLQPTLRAADLPARSGVRQSRRRARSVVSARCRGRTAPPASAGGTGRRRRLRAGARVAHPPGSLAGFTPSTTGWRPSATGAQGDLVVWAQEHLVAPVSRSRSTAASARRRSRGRELPAGPRAGRRRDHRPRDVGGAAALPARDGRLGRPRRASAAGARADRGRPPHGPLRAGPEVGQAAREARRAGGRRRRRPALRPHNRLLSRA